MPGNTGPDPSPPYLDLQAVPGGGMAFTYIDAAEAPAFGWSMSHSQALSLAARVLGILGYRELRIRDDYTVSSAS